MTKRSLEPLPKALSFLSITLKVYGHVLPDMQEAAVQQIDSAFAGIQ